MCMFERASCFGAAGRDLGLGPEGLWMPGFTSTKRHQPAATTRDRQDFHAALGHLHMGTFCALCKQDTFNI